MTKKKVNSAKVLLMPHPSQDIFHRLHFFANDNHTVLLLFPPFSLGPLAFVTAVVLPKKIRRIKLVKKQKIVLIPGSLILLLYSGLRSFVIRRKFAFQCPNYQQQTILACILSLYF